MTVNTTTSRVSYAGNGSTTAFAVNFYFLASADLVVIKTTSSGAQTTLVLNTDYTVSGAGNPAGGTVTCTTAPASTESLVIFRAPAETQLTDYQANDPFPAETHERALDKLTMIAQRLKDLTSRSLTLSDGDTTTASTALPSPVSNKLIGWNATATGLQNIDQSTLATIVAFGTASADTFSGNGTATSFTLSSNPAALNNLDVSISGVTQRPGIDYTWTSGTTITFTSAPPSGTDNILVRYLQALPQGASDSASSTFLQAGTGAVTRTAQAKMRDTVSVKDFGAVGDGVTDDTAAFAAAFAAAKNVYAPAPTVSYRLSSVTIPANRELLTDGFATVLHQTSGTAVGTRMLVIGGSNVRIGSMTVKGNIATDTDEQNHSVYIQANATTGSINNIHVADIRGEDIRGDVVYFGQATGAAYKLTNVHIGNISFDNVYRNGVSCVSADGFSVASVTGTRCGFMHIDLEPNVGSGPAVNGRIGYVKGRFAGLNSPAANDYIDNVEIGVMDLSPSYAAQSSPSYAPGVALADGLSLRNVRRANIGHFSAEGFNRCAAFVTYNAGELGCEYLGIDSARLRNCSITDVTYNSYIQCITLTSNHLSIGKIDAVISGSNKRVLDNLRSGFIRAAYVDAQTAAAFMRNCQNVQVGSIVQTGTGGFMWQACSNCSVGGGSFTGDRLATSSTQCRFENFTATAAVFLFSSGQENHVINNCTLNSDYYGYGVGIRAYTMPQRFGAYNLWVDATGDLRIKGSTPTSDTDGTVVGTQT